MKIFIDLSFLYSDFGVFALTTNIVFKPIKSSVILKLKRLLSCLILKEPAK
jgi:hypothetical protein